MTVSMAAVLVTETLDIGGNDEGSRKLDKYAS